MSNKQDSIFVWLVLAILAMILLVNYFFPQSPLGYTGAGLNVFHAGVTNSSTSVGVAATSILALNRDRQYAQICVSGVGGGIVWISLDADGDKLSEGTGLASSTYPLCYEIDATNLYTGAVYGITTNTTTVMTIEK